MSQKHISKVSLKQHFIDSFEVLKTYKTSSWTECVKSWIIRERGKDKKEQIKSLVEFSEDCIIEYEIQNLIDKGFQFPIKVNIYKTETFPLEAKVKIALLTILVLLLAVENFSVESHLTIYILRFLLRITVLSAAVQIYSWMKLMRPERQCRGSPDCPSTKLSPTLPKDGNLRNRFNTIKTLECNVFHHVEKRSGEFY